MKLGKRKIAKLAKLASELVKIEETAPKALLEDAVSICEYVSKKMGTELTVGEASAVRDMMDDMQEKERLTAASISAITVIDCTDAAEFTVQAVATFGVDDEGQTAAKELFADWVRSSVDDEEEVTDEQIDNAWAEGKYEIGEGFIAVVSSNFQRK